MGRPRKPTVEDAVDFWVQAKLRYGPIGRTTVYFAERFRDKMGSAKVLELSGADIAGYVNRGQGAAGQRREINTVKGIVNYYRKMHGEQPVYCDRPREGAGRQRWLSAKERDAFIEACPPDIKPIVTALFYTGARKGELMSLKPRQVDYEDRTINLGTLKGGRGMRHRVVPLHDRVWQFVEGTEGQDRVFPAPSGREWSDVSFGKRWWPVVVGLGMKDFKPHDARHTFASELVRQGVSLRVIADMLGHSSLAMVMRYSHVATEDSRAAVLRL